MKKLLLCIFLILHFVPFSLSAQDIYIPGKVEREFKTTYPNISNYHWQSTGENFAVTFKVANGQSLHVVFDTAGKVTEKYMALSSTFILPEIPSYINGNLPSVSVKNYWVKQKGAERIYKVEITDLTEGGGTISGSSNGLNNTASADSALTNATILPKVQFSSSESSFVYFDRYGKPISPKEATSGLYVAKPKESPKPAYRAYYYYNKKGKNGKKKR
jgi:hypothetical protein